MRFGLFRVRSPLLTESRLFSLPVGTEMFHFPTFPPTALCVQAEVARHDSGIQGFPIRRSPDRSSLTSSPGLIAGCNVLHRLLVPRHPPIALSSLLFYKDARVHCEVLKIRASPKRPGACASGRDGRFRRFVAFRNRTLRAQQRAWAIPHRSPLHSLTGCTRWSTRTGLVVNVPHSVARPAENERLGSERWTDALAPADGSLERR